MTTSHRIEDQEHYDPKTDFTCVECGSWVTRVIGTPDLKLCGHCTFTPGWFTDDRLRKVIDPTHSGEPYKP